MQTFLKISANFHDDCRWHGSALVYSFFCLVSQILVIVTSLSCLGFTISISPANKNKLAGTMSYSNKDLITFHHDAPNSYVPVFNVLEFLVNALQAAKHSESAKHASKSQAASAEKSFDYMIWLLITGGQKYDTNSKMYNIKVV